MKCKEQNIIIKIGKVFKIIIIASIKDQRRRAGCRGLAGLRKGFVAFFYKKPETSEKAKGWGGASRGAGAPLSGGHLPKGVGAAPYVPCSGVHLRSLTKPRNPLPSQRRFVGDRLGAVGLLSTLGSGGKTRLHILF